MRQTNGATPGRVMSCLLLLSLVSMCASMAASPPSTGRPVRAVRLAADAEARPLSALLEDPALVEQMLEDDEDDETLTLFRALKGISGPQQVAFVAPLASRATLAQANGAKCKLTKEETPAREGPVPLKMVASGKGDGKPSHIRGGLFSKLSQKLPGSLLASFFGLGVGSGLNLNANGPQGLNPLGVAPVNAADWPPPKTDQKRVLFLLSDTGGGHKASAKAIKGALDLMY